MFDEEARYHQVNVLSMTSKDLTIAQLFHNHLMLRCYANNFRKSWFLLAVRKTFRTRDSKYVVYHPVTNMQREPIKSQLNFSETEMSFPEMWGFPNAAVK